MALDVQSARCIAQKPAELSLTVGPNAVLQCQDCEFFRRGPSGLPLLACDPYSNIKEPECLQKWQLHQLLTIARSHQATLDMYKRLAPLQEKMFKQMEREIEETDEADRWKYENDEDGEPQRG